MAPLKASYGNSILIRPSLSLWTLAAVYGCVAGGRVPTDVPRQATGALGIRVIYPPQQDLDRIVRDRATVRADSQYSIGSQDSTFLLGSVGHGAAELAINGVSIPVYPTGTWLAWLPVPSGSPARFRLVATLGSDTVASTFIASTAARFQPPARGAWIDTTSFAPAGTYWFRPGEGYRMRVRATPAAEIRLVLQQGDTILFRSDRSLLPGSWGREAFAKTALPAADTPQDRYVGWSNKALGPDPGHVLQPDTATDAEDPRWAALEVIMGADTARARWPLRAAAVDEAVPPLALVHDDTAGTGATDEILPGRPVPYGPYHWFFPNGTVSRVSGRLNDQVRLQLSARSVAWVDAGAVLPLPRGTPPPEDIARSMRLIPGEGSVTLRVPLTYRIPFRVDEDETDRSVTLRLYGAAADMDWIQYGGTDPFVKIITFAQPSEDEVDIRVQLTQPLWGYRTRWSGGDLLLEIRRPPDIDRRRPLRDMRIAVDAGHPPGGARGPSGIREAQVTLGVSRRLRGLLESRGAEVVMIRDAEAGVSLIGRTKAAELADAHILVSIHANALPDGVNPFANSGTSVYYYHPRSVELARLVDRELVGRLGYRDLGIGRGDLHMARPTWMPAVLTEGLFMMIPEQEAVLSSEEGQVRYATGIRDGIEAFLRMRARDAAALR